MHIATFFSFFLVLVVGTVHVSCDDVVSIYEDVLVLSNPFPCMNETFHVHTQNVPRHVVEKGLCIHVWPDLEDRRDDVTVLCTRTFPASFEMRLLVYGTHFIDVAMQAGDDSGFRLVTPRVAMVFALINNSASAPSIIAVIWVVSLVASVGGYGILVSFLLPWRYTDKRQQQSSETTTTSDTRLASDLQPLLSRQKQKNRSTDRAVPTGSRARELLQ